MEHGRKDNLFLVAEVTCYKNNQYKESEKQLCDDEVEGYIYIF